jgi:putative transposase
MIRTYNYPLRPNVAQTRTLDSWLGACQRLYNGALEERREAYRKQGVSLSLYDQHKELTELRTTDVEYTDISVWVLRSVLQRLDDAYRAFFRRVKLGQKPGFPRFRSRDRYTSFSFLSNGVQLLRGHHLHVPKLGFVRVHLYRPLPANAAIKLARVKRCADGTWRLSLVVDLGAVPPKRSQVAAVGIDVGLTTFVTLSNGEKIENPRFFRTDDVLASRQQSVARKKRGSSSRRRAKILVVRAYARIRNQRLDFARKTAAILFSRFDCIVHEDLKISCMVHSNLAKSIYDAGWGIFFQCLANKAEEAGLQCIGVNPYGTSQRCSGCGNSVPKELSEREHRCGSCGLVLGRDHNAALNILALGLSALEAA